MDDGGWEKDDDGWVMGNLLSSALWQVAGWVSIVALVAPNVNGDWWVVPIAPQ